MTDESHGDVSFFGSIPHAWFEDSTILGVVIRGYSSGIAGHPDLCQRAILAMKSFISILPSRFDVSFSSTQGEQPMHVMDEIVTFHESEIRMNVNVRQGILPEGHYACITLPIYDNDENSITQKTDVIRGILTLIAGHSALSDLVFEQRFDLSQPDQITRSGRTVEAHLHPNQWHVFNDATIKSVAPALKDCPSELRDRTALAMSFIARATNVIDHTVRFGNTWIAFEVMAGGHAAAKNFLNGLDPNFKHEAKRFIDMRNALFHHGKRPVFEQWDERFLCACIIAILLKQLGITDEGFSKLVHDHLADHPPV